MKRLLRMIRRCYNVLYQNMKPLQYARKIGVNIADSVRFTGTTRWGSEPWLISVGDNTVLAHDVKFTTHDGGVAVVNKDPKYKDVIKFGRVDIGKNCFIGAGARFMPDVIVGDNCIVGADSLVTKDIPSNQVWGGVPAQFICTIDAYAEKCLRETPEYDVFNLDRNIREESIIIANKRRALRRH